MEIVLLVIGLVFGAAAGFLIAKFKYNTGDNAVAADYDAVKLENLRLATDKAKAEERSSILDTSLSETRKELEAERSKSGSVQSELSKMQAVNENLAQKLD